MERMLNVSARRCRRNLFISPLHPSACRIHTTMQTNLSLICFFQLYGTSDLAALGSILILLPCTAAVALPIGSSMHAKALASHSHARMIAASLGVRSSRPEYVGRRMYVPASWGLCWTPNPAEYDDRCNAHPPLLHTGCPGLPISCSFVSGHVIAAQSTRRPPCAPASILASADSAPCRCCKPVLLSTLLPGCISCCADGS